MIHPTLEKWHSVIKSGNNKLLKEILADDVVFHSPVVWTPQKGKKITFLYLAAAGEVLGGENFEYLREIVNDKQFVLEFSTEIDGIVINGVDMIELNDAGQIIDFKVMLRPLKAINLVHRKMGEMLMKMK